MYKSIFVSIYLILGGGGIGKFNDLYGLVHETIPSKLTLKCLHGYLLSKLKDHDWQKWVEW